MGRLQTETLRSSWREEGRKQVSTALQEGSPSIAQAAFKLESFCLSLLSGIVGMR